MQTLEVGVIRRHAVVLQVLDGVHALLRHILLGQHLRELTGAVVAEVDEDDDVAFLNGAVDLGVVDGLDELIGHAVGVALVHCLEQVVGLFALALNEQVVGFLDAVPALVAVHGVETADDGGDVGVVLLAAVEDVLDEALTALWIGIAAVHEAVHEGVLQSVFLGNLDELEQMVKRGVHATR